MTRKLNKYLKFQLVIYLMLSIYVNNVNSMQIGYSLSAGVENSDNITRTSINEISGTTRRLGLSASINHHSDSVSFNFTPRIEYFNYTPEELEDHTLYHLDSSLLWQIIDSRFFWTFEDYIDQTAINVTAPETPFNAQTTNVFLTGPDLHFLLEKGKSIELLIRYADFYFEVDEELDNQRYGLRLRLISQPSPLFSYSINMDAVDVSYKEEIFNQNYNRYDVYLEANKLGNLYNLDLTLGYSIVEREFSEDLIGLLANFNYELTPSPKSRLIILGRSEYTDSSRNFLQSRAFSEDVRRFNTAISSEIFYENYLFGIYQWDDGITTISADASIADQDYEEETLTEPDRLIKDAGIQLRRRVTSLTDVFLRAGWRNTNYKRTSREDIDEIYSLGLSYRLSRSLFITADYEYAARDSNYIIANYTENSIFFSVVFRR